jgi:hypothetical protein
MTQLHWVLLCFAAHSRTRGFYYLWVLLGTVSSSVSTLDSLDFVYVTSVIHHALLEFPRIAFPSALASLSCDGASVSRLPFVAAILSHRFPDFRPVFHLWLVIQCGSLIV